MYEMTIDVDNQPEWCVGYFRRFNEWYREEAPKPLPKDVDNYIELFSKHIGIDFDVSSNVSADQSRIESFTFKWTTEQERTFFILKF